MITLKLVSFDANYTCWVNFVVLYDPIWPVSSVHPRLTRLQQCERVARELFVYPNVAKQLISPVSRHVQRPASCTCSGWWRIRSVGVRQAFVSQAHGFRAGYGNTLFAKRGTKKSCRGGATINSQGWIGEAVSIMWTLCLCNSATWRKVHFRTLLKRRRSFKCDYFLQKREVLIQPYFTEP